MDLARYREHVKNLAAERKGEVVYNGSADHAAVIVEHMFASAHENVRILTGDLNAKVYGALPVVQRARQFLGHSDHRLEILVEEHTFNSSHPLIEEIGTDENVAIYVIPPELSQKIPYHFMTVDNDCFRFEREKNSHAAVAAFGEKETAEHLNSIFDAIVPSCTQLDKSEICD